MLVLCGGCALLRHASLQCRTLRIGSSSRGRYSSRRGFGCPASVQNRGIQIDNETGIQERTGLQEASSQNRQQSREASVSIPGQDEQLFLELEQQRMAAQAKRATSRSRKVTYTLESELRFTLDHCSKFGDVWGALSAYESSKGEVKFDQYNYNILLYLCSSAALGVLTSMKRSKQRPDNQDSSDEVAGEIDGVCLRGNMAGLVGKNTMGLSQEMMDLCLQKGLEIFEEMQAEKVPPNEATYTALARLAVAKNDGDLAFGIVKNMPDENIAPKLRSYGPALLVYFKQKNASKAFEVYTHMLACGVEPEEVELELLLELSRRAGWHGKVYALLYKLRETVRDVSPSTIRVLEKWFASDCASRIEGSYAPSSNEVRAALVRNGGGWHGLGWLGRGPWKVSRSEMSESGVCCCCKEQLVAIDIDPQETEDFGRCVAGLAAKREQGNSFARFKEWLRKHGPFDAVIDGANAGVYGQSFSGQINFAQLNAVVEEVRKMTGKWPLIVLHNRRTTSGPARAHNAQQMLRRWSMANALYASPPGANDDWYWLYAAVSCKALLVSNDEMRDHIFQILGRDFFPKWKERHQVRFRVVNRGPQFFMPPPYSITIQESETGSWHVPIAGGDDISVPRQWLCVTRPGAAPD